MLIGLRRPVAQHESSGENIKDANRLSTTEALRSGKCQSLGNIVISQPLKNSQLEGAANNIATAEVVQQGHHHGRSHSLGTTSSRFRTSRVTTEWDQGGDWTMGKKNRDLSQQQHRGTQVHATNRPPPSQPKHLYATKELVERRSAAKAAPNSLALLDDDDAFLESKWDTLKTGYDTDDGDKKRKPKLRSSLLKRKGRLFRQKRITSERYKGGADDDVSSCSSSVTSNVLDNTDRSLSGDVSTLSSNKMPSRKSLPNSFSGSLASKLAPDATIGSSSNAFDADMNGMECPSPSKFTSGRRSSAPSPSMMVRRGKLRIHHQHAHVTGLANQQEAQLNDNDMEEYF